MPLLKELVVFTERKLQICRAYGASRFEMMLCSPQKKFMGDEPTFGFGAHSSHKVVF
jgi:hypothetical protein